MPLVPENCLRPEPRGTGSSLVRHPAATLSRPFLCVSSRPLAAPDSTTCYVVS